MTDQAQHTAGAKYTAPLQDPMDMLAEEGLEVAHERMKALRFGWEGSPEWLARGKGSPRTRFIQEVGDFLVAVDLAVQEGKISADELAAAKAKKRERLKELFGIPLPSTETARSEDVAVPRKWLEELAYFRVRDIRGSDDVPGFDICVKSELNKMLQSLAAAPRPDANSVFGSSIDLSCGFSCDGIVVAGDRKSIDAVQRWRHDAGTVPYLKDRIAELQTPRPTPTGDVAAKLAEMAIPEIHEEGEPAEAGYERGYLKQTLKEHPLAIAQSLRTMAKMSPPLGSHAGHLWAMYEYAVAVVAERKALAERAAALEQENERLMKFITKMSKGGAAIPDSKSFIGFRTSWPDIVVEAKKLIARRALGEGR